MMDVERPHRPWLLLALGLLAVAAISLASACSEYSCTEIGCASGLRCNADSGECEELRRSCRQSGCPSGEVCDEASGICHAEGTRCVDNSCPSRQVCNAQTGFCEARSDCQLDPCASAAEQCDPVSGQCIPRVCDDDTQCPTSYYCAAQGECRAGCRIGAEDGCPSNEFCRASIGETIGQCRKTCHADDDCPLGELCRQTADGSACEAEPRCEDDQDCRADGVCIEHICHPPPCTTDDDCSSDEICDVATGTCIGGGCEEDIHAPNQRLADAAELQPGSYSGLQLCPGKADWFRVQMRSSDAFDLRLEHAPGVDLDIFVFSPEGVLLGANQQTSPVTTLSLLSERAQSVSVLIKSTSLDSSAYDLQVERNPSQAFCRDDTSEENDHPGQAVVLPTDTTAPFEASLGLCGGDEDWFVLPDLGAEQGLVVTRSGASPGVYIDLYAPDHEIFELREARDDEPEQIHIERLGADGDYLVRVRSWLGRSASYRLRTQLLAPFDCPQAGESATAESATPISPNAVSLFAFCPLEQSWELDFLELASPAEDGTLTVQFVAVGDLPELDVVLLEETDEGLRPIRNALPTQNYYQLRAPVQGGQRYLVRVSADGEPGRIVDGVDYQIFYRYESSD